MPGMGPQFVPGLELSRRFYHEAVGPLLRRHFGELTHTAALIGGGSEVLGFDTDRSTDHDWGPRLQIFLGPADAQADAEKIVAMLADHLPKTFLGYPTNLGAPADDGTRCMRFTDGRVRHGVVVATLDDWLTGHFGFDPRAAVTTFDWLATPTQTLAEFTAGAIFHDGLRQLEPARRRLAWYPDDIWRYLLACQWQRISQEEAFVGRSGEVGDELGSAIVAARLVRDLMRLCLLMARRYPPYSKWLGSAFGQLPCVGDLTPTFTGAVAATAWRDREHLLAGAYESVAAMHNDLGLTSPVDPRTRPYHDRPFRVLHAGRFTAALVDSISDETVRGLPLIGAVDQFVDRTDVLYQHMWVRRSIETSCQPGQRR